MAARTFHAIRNDIIAGTLTPGTKLHAERLKKLYNVGSSPLREALTQLTANGLVSAQGQRGFRVTEVSLKDLSDITKTRIHIEVHAFRQSIALGDVEWEIAVSGSYRRLVNAINELQNDETGATENWEVLHRDFHLSLIQACGSPWLISFCHRLYEQFERYRNVFVEYRKIPETILAEHQIIHEAALDRDSDRAAELLHNHIILAARLTERDARKHGVQDADEIKSVI
ncbi:MAG: FCD domain-containing protein [Alphaproteobacteria bacterium]|nr:FCD domain-containing protein [Alphaproteobacteria bacterium]